MCWPRLNSRRRSMTPPVGAIRCLGIPLPPPPPSSPPALKSRPDHSHHITDLTAISSTFLLPVFDGPPSHPVSLPACIYPYHSSPRRAPLRPPPRHPPPRWPPLPPPPRHPPPRWPPLDAHQSSPRRSPLHPPTPRWPDPSLRQSSPTSLPPALPTTNLLSLPPELHLDIAEYLLLRTIFHLHLCCRHLHSVFLHKLDNAVTQHAEHVLTWSIYRNNPRQLSRALAAGAFFTTKYMTLAITLDHAPLLTALFAALPSYSINTHHPQHATPLHHAVTQNAEGCVAALLRGGALPDFEYNQGGTALFYALRGGYKGVARALVAEGAAREIRGGDAMLYAVRERPWMVGVLAEAGWVGARVRGRPTPLQTAVRAGWVGVLKVLLEAGAGVDELGDGRGTGWAPLYECVIQKARESMMDLLIQKGASVRVLGGASVDGGYQGSPGEEMGLTPLQLARRK